LAVAWLASSAGCSSSAPTPTTQGPKPEPPVVQQANASFAGRPHLALEPTTVLHPATSYVIATNRNHVKAEVPADFGRMLAAYANVRPAFGAQRKLYRIGHGPFDGRLDFDYMTGYHFEKVWGKDGPYPYDDLRHGLAEAKALDADVIMVVNYGTGDAGEAGRLVSYLNGANDATRKVHGLAPFNVKLFEIGNEIGWSVVRGHAEYAPDEKTFARRAKQFAAEMRANSDVPIEIGVPGSINSNWSGEGWAPGAAGVGNIIDIMGEDVNFLIFHGYPSWPLKRDGEPLTVMAQNAWNRDKLSKEILPAISAARDRNGISHPIDVANTEYFTELYHGPYQRGVLEALYAADTMATTLALGLRMAVNFCFFHGELADSLFFRNASAEQRTTVFSVHELAASSLGQDVIGARSHDVPSVRVTGSEATTVVDMEQVGYAATRRSDGTVVLLVVNRTETDDVTLAVDAGMLVRRARQMTLSGGTYASLRFERTEQALASLDAVSFPKASVSVLELSP
jgi:hypothetical protein